MKTKTVKTEADIFHNRVTETIAVSQKQLVEAKAKFLEVAAKNPSWAIETLGEHVSRCEEAFKSIDHLRLYLSSKNYATRKEAVQACLDYFRNHLIQAATDSPSSNSVANGVSHAKNLGIADTVYVLERLVTHEFI